jgi:protein-disulfide isomerase
MANNKSRKMAIIAMAAVGILVAGSVTAFVTMGANSQPAQQMTGEQITTALLSPSVAGAPALGSADAPITIVEFGDYQCTWCTRFHQDTKDPLVANFVDTGKVRFLFKDFPIHDRSSWLAAEASYCAADQGKYWEFHDRVYDEAAYLYENRLAGENSGWITKASLNQYASDIGVADDDAFSECLDSGKYSALIQQNYNLARTISLDSTPNFIILGSDGSDPTLFRGAFSYSAFEEQIEKSLASNATSASGPLG